MLVEGPLVGVTRDVTLVVTFGSPLIRRALMVR